MSKLLRLLVLASVVAGLFTLGGMTASPAAASANFPLRLTVFEAPGTGILAGRLENVDPSLAFVTVTVMLRDGTSRSVNVDASTNWQFSFGVLPDDGFIGISVTEVPIPQPTLIGNEWDYAYRYGFYYGYPFDNTPWSRFPGYSWPAGYGWGYYPFGYYAYGHHLNYNYGVPFYWNYPPLYNTPNYVYYGICGLPNTYIAPNYQYSYFGQLYQPTYAVSAAPVAFGTPIVNTYQVAAVDPAPVQTQVANTVVVPANNGRTLPVVIPDNEAKQQALQSNAVQTVNTVQTAPNSASPLPNPAIAPNNANRTLPVTIPDNQAKQQATQTQQAIQNNVAPANVQAAPAPAANPAVAPTNPNRTLPVTIPDNQAKQQATNNLQPLTNNAAPVNNAPAPVVKRQQVAPVVTNPAPQQQQQQVINKAPVVTNPTPPQQQQQQQQIVNKAPVVNQQPAPMVQQQQQVVNKAPVVTANSVPPPQQAPIVKPTNAGQRPTK